MNSAKRLELSWWARVLESELSRSITTDEFLFLAAIMKTYVEKNLKN
jgi:hypothetical protein